LVFSNPLGNNKDVYFSQKDTLAKDSSYWSLVYSSRSIISPLKKFAKFFVLSSSVSSLDIFVDELVFVPPFFIGRKLSTSFWFFCEVFIGLLLFNCLVEKLSIIPSPNIFFTVFSIKLFCFLSYFPSLEIMQL